MIRFFKVPITKRPVGTAVEHKEPAMQGEVIIKVTDSTTAGDNKIFVLDCNDAQKKTNLAIPGVEELSEAQAVKLAAKFQPRRTFTELNPLTGKEEKITVQACDLKKFYKPKAAGVSKK